MSRRRQPGCGARLAVCVAAQSLTISCVVAVDSVSFFGALTPDISLIVMDMKIPGMNCEELMTQLAHLGCKTEIILMSRSARRFEALPKGLVVRWV
jgi:CheY-like chemotaxis protein